MVEEASLMANNVEWICDTRLSRHFCTNKEHMHEFEDVTDGECV